MERMQAELATLDPRALENLPKELKDSLPKGMPGLGGASCRSCPDWAAADRGCRACPAFRERRNEARGQVSGSRTSGPSQPLKPRT
jgi:hypothetical protein